MSEGKISMKKAIPIIVVAWVLSLVTTLVIAYFTPFVPIGTNQIGDSAITADKIADGAIITTTLADGSVTSAKILDGAIVAQDIADGSIVTVKVADGAITTAKIADSAITSTKIADGAIVTIKLADSAVSTSKLADDAVVSVKLADGAVTSAKILDGTITAADLATGAVTEVKIADGAITTTKIADYAVTSLKLATNAIPFNSTGWYNSETKTTAIWENITGMEVTLTLERNSTLIIMFSTEAQISSSTEYIRWRAMVNATQAHPGEVYLHPITSTAPSIYSPISYNFYLEGLTPGKYPIYMQWYVTGAATALVYFRTLIVIALPA